MQLAQIASRPTPFQQQLAEVVTTLDDALDVSTDRTHEAIRDDMGTIESALEGTSSSDARSSAVEAYHLLGESADALATDWSLEPPHTSGGLGNLARLGVLESIRLLNEAIQAA